VYVKRKGEYPRIRNKEVETTAEDWDCVEGFEGGRRSFDVAEEERWEEWLRP